MQENYIYNADGEDFAKALVGQRISEIQQDRIILADGTELVIEDGGDCCAFFEGWFEQVGDPTDAAITSVTTTGEKELDDYNMDVNFTVHIYAAHRLIANATVEGNAGSGYYGSSITLVVRSA